MCGNNKRKIIVIEAFEARNDTTSLQPANESLSVAYTRGLGFWNQRLLFALNTFLHRSRIQLIPQDSAQVQFPDDQRFAFSFIDGNHSPEYVRGDFEKIFAHTSVNGYIAMHDYGSPHLPEITGVIDAIQKEYAGKIVVHQKHPRHYTIIFRKIAA